MKAVIMAGGEGTRLRPLTSNAPKPMLTVADRPMMEHVLDLLRRHGITDVVVTVVVHGQRHPGLLRRRLGVRRRAAPTWTSPRRSGRQGRSATPRDLLTERFLVLSGDVVTDIDLSRIIDFHVEHEALATIGLTPVDRPARVRHRDHARGRLDRPVPREADVGPGLQRHDQHGHLRPRARDLRADRSRRPGRLLGRGLPGAPARGPAAVRRGDRRGTGRTSARSTPT